MRDNEKQLGCKHCKYHDGGKCTHPHATHCYHCELWTPKWYGKGITHCKDCQHCALEFKEQRFGEPSKYVRVCLLHDHETTLDDYCSLGLRKDDGE